MATVTKVKKGQVLEYKYTGGVQSVTLPAGTYKLEVCGAEGGTAINNYGGYGGYSVGTLTLIDESTVLYIQVGGRPASVGDDRVVVPGGYNGGGNGYNRYYDDTATYGQGGGGGTDIRIGQDSLYARVIVAGGGGGSASNGNERATKYGGGLTGGCGLSTYADKYVGTQTSGGTYGNPGSFGQGGDAYTSKSNYKYGSGGGGGGWYGGSAIASAADSGSDEYRPANGGGSGYVYTASTAANYPSGCLLNSSYYLTDAQTIAGNESFPLSNSGTGKGYIGSGYARITVLDAPSSISAPVRVDGQWHQANEMFVKVNNVWNECVEAWMKVDGVWKSLAESTITYDASWLDNLALGDTFTFGKYQVESETPWAIEWEIVHQTDEYQIAQTKQIIDLRCFDAKESNNTDSNRKNYGNNKWSVSNIKQFLNSDQSSWYSTQHSYDALPNSSNVAYSTPYDTHKGFLYYFSDEEKNLLKDMTITLANPTTDGESSYTWTGKVWLPTYTQISGNQNNSISEGTKFDKYNSNNDRIKTIHPNCKLYNPYAKSSSGITSNGAWLCWMSSAYPSSSYTVRCTTSGGGTGNNSGAYSGSNGLAPCICLPRTTSTPKTYAITAGTNVTTISVNGVPTLITFSKQIVLVSKGDTIIVTSDTFNANTNSMRFSYTPTGVSLSNKKTSYGTGTLASTEVTFTMPASDLTVKFTKTSGSIA